MENRLTVFSRTIDHVELVNLFGIILSLCVLLPATLLPVPPQLLDQLLGAVIKGQDLVGNLTGTYCLGRTGQPQFTEDLSPHRLHPLLLDVVNVHSGASGERQSHCHAVREEEKQECVAQIHVARSGAHSPTETRGVRKKVDKTVLNRIPPARSSLFIQVVRESRSCSMPIFSQALCHGGERRACMGADPCHFGGSGGERSQFLIKTSCPNLHHPESHHASTPPRPVSSRAQCAPRRLTFSIASGLFSIHLCLRSQCALPPSLPLALLLSRSRARSCLPRKSSLKHTPGLGDSHFFFIVASSDVAFGGRGSES